MLTVTYSFCAIKFATSLTLSDSLYPANVSRSSMYIHPMCSERCSERSTHYRRVKAMMMTKKLCTHPYPPYFPRPLEKLLVPGGSRVLMYRLPSDVEKEKTFRATLLQWFVRPDFVFEHFLTF